MRWEQTARTPCGNTALPYEIVMRSVLKDECKYSKSKQQVKRPGFVG